MRIILKKVRLAFPQLWTAKKFKETDQNARYSATFLVEPGSANDKSLRGIILEAGTNAWGQKVVAARLNSINGNTQKMCYVDGDLKADKYDYFGGLWSLAAHRRESEGPPMVIDKDLSKLDEASGRPYAGCYVNAAVDIWAQKAPNEGIRASLLTVQFLGDGEAFSGSRPTIDGFEALESAEGQDFRGFTDGFDEFISG